MSRAALNKQILEKEISVSMRSIEATIERFELDLLKTRLEAVRLEEELGRSKATLQEKAEELKKLQEIE